MAQKTDEKDRKYDIILNIKVNSTDLVEVLRQISDWVNKKRRFLVVTPNPEIVMLAQNDMVLSGILNSADISLPDGMGLVWASKYKVWRKSLFGNDARIVRGKTSNVTAKRNGLPNRNLPTITHRISGVDIMEKLIILAAKRSWRVFLLGGRVGTAAAAAQKLKIKSEKLKIEIDSGPWLDDEGKPVNQVELEKERRVIEKINKFHPHLLFVGFGAPKQEKWVRANYNKIQTYGTMVVGGAFDYLSGSVPRAPEWARSMGLEWLFRLVAEPWRIKRQLALVRFVWTVLTSKI